VLGGICNCQTSYYQNNAGGGFAMSGGTGWIDSSAINGNGGFAVSVGYGGTLEIYGSSITGSISPPPNTYGQNANSYIIM
jgi:hypothetical protein